MCCITILKACKQAGWQTVSVVLQIVFFRGRNCPSTQHMDSFAAKKLDNASNACRQPPPLDCLVVAQCLRPLSKGLWQCRGAVHSTHASCSDPKCTGWAARRAATRHHPRACCVCHQPAQDSARTQSSNHASIISKHLQVSGSHTPSYTHGSFLLTQCPPSRLLGLLGCQAIQTQPVPNLCSVGRPPPA